MNKSQKWMSVSAVASFLVCAAGFGQTLPRTALLSWGAVTQDVDGGTLTGVCYRIYQGPRGFTPDASARIGTCQSALTYTASNLPAGEMCFRVSAFTPTNGEGAPSNEGCKSFAFPVPRTVTLTVQ